MRTCPQDGFSVPKSSLQDGPAVGSVPKSSELVGEGEGDSEEDDSDDSDDKILA